MQVKDGSDWFRAEIYDSYCNIIGYYDNPYQGLAIDSQLPYTVDLNYLSFGSDFHTIGMCYAAYCFQGTFDCYMYGDAVSCQHAFPC
jgi:hypothetical protein